MTTREEQSLFDHSHLMFNFDYQNEKEKPEEKPEFDEDKAIKNVHSSPTYITDFFKFFRL